MDFSPTLIACRTASERARLPDGMDACHGLATSPQRASWTTRPADAKRVFRRLCTPRARPASPRTGAGPDGRAGSTALRSAAWGPPACAAGLMRSTRAHGAGIAAIAAIRLSPRGTAHERQARLLLCIVVHLSKGSSPRLPVLSNASFCRNLFPNLGVWPEDAQFF